MNKVYFDRTCISFDSEESYNDFRSRFFEVNAAGGAVADDDGRYLLIRRNGLWDLPKGHQEQGEDIRDCAIREVEEETGIKPVMDGGLICITDHCYFRNGKWHLKHTWWYRMRTDKTFNPVPQVEEGISEVRWMEGSEIKNAMKNSYASINDVFLKLL